MWNIHRHFSTPQKPHIEGIEDFKGQQIHSHDYREPSPYTDSKVIILGAGASGLDILMEVSTVAKEVRIRLFVIQLNFVFQLRKTYQYGEGFHMTFSFYYYCYFCFLILGTSFSQPPSSLPFWVPSKCQTRFRHSESCGKWVLS